MLLLLFFIDFLIAQKLCPNNGYPFDYQPCEPQFRSECPAGFTCRLSQDTSNNNASVYLCCESGSMTISDWFTEKRLSPEIFPQIPYSTIKALTLSPISQNLKFPPIHIGDEVVVLSFPSYVTGIVESVRMEQSMNSGYVHVVTVIDAAYRPFAVLVNYNIQLNESSAVINVNSSQKFTAYLDTTTNVPNRESYRTQYTVFVYYTPSAIQFDGSSPQEMLLGSCTDAKCLFSDSPFSAKLNQPSAGTLFYLTTKKTFFATEGSIENHTSLPTFPLVLFIFWLLF